MYDLSQRKVRELQSALEGYDAINILIHDDPDPDALASAWGLCELIKDQEWGSEPKIVTGGFISRPDNRAMVDDLDIPLTYIDNLQEPPSGGYICVDTRPSFSNNSLPDDAHVLGVMDHHGTGDDIGLPFEDLRTNYGAVTTVVGEYLTVTGIEISENMATAITYGIIAETQDLVRFGDEADIQIYTRMLPLANQPLLGKLRHPPVERAFFRALTGALKVSRICSNVVVCHLEELNSPDELARVADALITLEEVNWALCTGIEKEALRLSLRSSSRDAEAEKVMATLVGGRGGCGGHGMMAGGRMELEGDDVAELRKTLTDRLLNSVGTDKEAEFEPLV